MPSTGTLPIVGNPVWSVRTNPGGSVFLIAVVTYADATTDTLEVEVARLVP